MKTKIICFFISGILFLPIENLKSQTNIDYHISFKQASHHIADISATFKNTELKPLEVRMSRTSPGRYALHEFAKNVFDVSATDSKGNTLEISRPDPYSWLIAGHDGTVNLKYKLFGDRGDGTYAQIDNSHAHLNIPATFMYAPSLTHKPIEVSFDLSEHPNWKIATQLKKISDNTYYAPNLHYFMDSPIEISDFRLKEWNVTSSGKTQKIQLAIHDPGNDETVQQFTEKVKAIVEQAKDVYGELPDFDYGEYTFLACYMPQVSGDGMEHRNSTILTTSRSLENGGLDRNIGTVSHEFFHAWNVERIRPSSLEPFDYTKANMSGELWFAEGFTSYYTNLLIIRAGLLSEKDYLSQLQNLINYVNRSPGKNHFNVIEMSYQAPFVDAAASVDPVNRGNTFISYYTYGSYLGLALDLSLRNAFSDKTLDGFMQEMWKKYGKTEIAYTVKDLQNTLEIYAGKEFGSQFFEKYIYHSGIPEWSVLFENMGLLYTEIENSTPNPGVYIAIENELPVVQNYPLEGSSAWNAEWDKGDVITKINGKAVNTLPLKEVFEMFDTEATNEAIILRNGKEITTTIGFKKEKSSQITKDSKAKKKIIKKRKEWLGVEF